ncbi:ankyrin repeat-containing domain protein, partial [Baffinella frigidus]
TPLMCAVSQGNKQVAQLLLGARANVNAQTENGWTPLHYAINGGRTNETSRSIVTMLLDKGADPRMETRKGVTPLHHAALGGDDAAVKLLLDIGADARAKTNAGEPLLHFFLRQESELVHFVLDKVAQAKGIKGMTPLEFAALGWEANRSKIFFVSVGVLD